MNNELIVGIGAAILTSFVGPITVTYFKELIRKKSKNEETDILRETIEVDRLITSKLEEIKEKYSTDRIWLCQFHNGGYYYPTGKSIQKFSMVYEIAPGVSSVQSQFQNVPTGLFSKTINTLLEGVVIKILNDKDFNYYGLSSIAEQTNAKSSYIFPLTNIDNKFIGMVGISFKNITTLEQGQLNDLELEINTISGVLMRSYSNNIKK